VSQGKREGEKGEATAAPLFALKKYTATSKRQSCSKLLLLFNYYYYLYKNIWN